MIPMHWVIAALPILLLLPSATIPLLYITTKKVLIVDTAALISAAFSLAISFYTISLVVAEGPITYYFGGFPPPLGITYIIDEASATLGTLATFSLLLSIIYGSWILDPKWRYLYYTATFLLIAGCVSYLYTADIFNLYVSAELISISSYVLASFYRGKGIAIRAASIYAISASLVLSLLLLSAFLIYGSYGTLNMADLALKSRDPNAEVLFSGTVFGDIVLASKIVLALILWVMLFKSAIMPNHFWLPGVYSGAPTPAVALFTASADIIGIYGIARLFLTVFGSGIVFEDYRRILMTVLTFIAAGSSLASATLVSLQRNVRGIVAYSTISQFSLALMGITTNINEGAAGAIFHLVSNSLGDMLVLYSAGMATALCGRSLECLSTLRKYKVAYISLILGFLNLFGIIPILPGFWSKAILTLAFIKTEFPAGSVIVLASSGLCAAGYFRVLISSLRPGVTKKRTQEEISLTIPTITLILLIITTLALGVSLLFFEDLRNFLVFNVGNSMVDYKRYIRIVLGV